MNPLRREPSWQTAKYAGDVGELVFIGLGLNDETGMTLRGLEEARTVDTLFMESYTSAFSAPRRSALERLIGKPVRQLTRDEVERGTIVLDAARTARVAFLVVGDPMTATTHVDLRLRAAKDGIPTRIVHGTSIVTAAAGVLGLQIYKFGRITTVPFPAPGFRPASPVDAIIENRRAGLHSLVLLDLDESGRFLGPKEAFALILEGSSERGVSDPGPATVACIVSRAGAPDVRATSGRIADLKHVDPGPPPHCLVVPGKLHFLEKEALIAFAGAPHDI
jgi:diphthine synthase